MRIIHSIRWRVAEAVDAVFAKLRGFTYDHAHKMYRDRSGELVGGYEEPNDERWGYLTPSQKKLAHR